MHRARLVMVRKFPRAAFGMPIITHFKNVGEPRDTSLAPRDRERMASPLIIRPVRVGDTFQAAALVLNWTPPLQALALKGAGREWPVSGVLTLDEASNLRLPAPFGPNVLYSFLDFFAA